MHASRGRGARQRATTTDLDASGAAYDFAPFIHEDPVPPVLHLVWAPREASLDLPSQATMEAIVAARKRADVDPHANSVWMDPQDWLDLSFPRGLPWTDYPVVGNPRFKTWRGMSVPSFRMGHDRAVTTRSYSQQEIARVAGTVMLHLPPHLDSPRFEQRSVALDWVCQALEVVRRLGANARVLTVGDGGEPMAGTGYLAARVSWHAPWTRFHYSYALNFHAIAAKALERSLAVADPDTASLLNSAAVGAYTPDRSNAATARRVGSRLGLGRFADPLAIQVLYDLRKRGGIEVGTAVTRDGWRLGLYPMSDDARPVWTGTGRYAPRPLGMREADSVASSLVLHHMLRFREGVVTLSATGEAFLDMLHPDCEDPDMPLRWARHPLSDEDREAMDAWIGRTFRKMKDRINRLP